FNWMENIQPWCISRQLWWGHQIPAWYGFLPDEQVSSVTEQKSRLATFVAMTEAEALAQARAFYGCDDVHVVESEREAAQARHGSKTFVIWRDEDVLDTWFSSALWPFSTLGWPEQ